MKPKNRSASKYTQAELDKRDSAATDMRPEMLERGRRLLADPDWPGIGQARELARTILPSLY